MEMDKKEIKKIKLKNKKLTLLLLIILLLTLTGSGYIAYTIYQNKMIESIHKNLKTTIQTKKNAKIYDPKYEAIYRDIEDSFTGYFGTKVKVNAGKRSGKIVIEYKSNDDLERILGLIK